MMGKNLRRLALVMVAASVGWVAGCGDDKNDDHGHVPPESIEVLPAAPTVVAGTSIQFTAIGHYEDQSTNDLTEDSNWASSDETVATIDEMGVATTVTTGTATISAEHDEVTGSTTITVTTGS